MTSFLLRAHLALGAAMLGGSVAPADALARDPTTQEASPQARQGDPSKAEAGASVLTLDDPPADKLLSPLSRLRSLWS